VEVVLSINTVTQITTWQGVFVEVGSLSIFFYKIAKRGKKKNRLKQIMKKQLNKD